MVALRWLLVLACSVIADFANPALPGPLEALANTEEAVYLSGYQRPAGVRHHADRPVARGAEAAKVARAVALRHHVRGAADPASSRPACKVPPSGVADGPTAPDDH